MSDEDVLRLQAPQAYATAVMGPVQAGYQVQLMIYSVFLCLFFKYWQTGELRNHNKAGRMVLVVALFLNSLYTGFVFYESYVAAVSQVRTVNRLSNNDVLWNVIPLLGSIIAAVTEGFLAVRAATLIPSKALRYLFCIWMTLLIICVLLGGILTCYSGAYYTLNEDDPDAAPFIDWNTACGMFLWGSAVADVSISLACAYGLRSRIAGFNEVTDGLLRRLALIAWRTASYTSVLSVIGAVLLAVYGQDDDVDSWIAIAFWIPIAGLYGISLFTFASSSRRAIHSSLNPASHPTYLPQVRPVTPLMRQARPGEAGLQSGTDQHQRKSTKSCHDRTPLQISVQQESQVVYDDERERTGERDSDGSVGLTTFDREEEKRRRPGGGLELV